MTRTHPYDRTWNPPAVALKVKVENRFTGQQHPTDELAMIDSGADGTNIPVNIANNLGLQPVDFVEVKDYAGNSHGYKAVYDVRVIIDAKPFDVRAAETDGEFLIGRDLINIVKLILDGPRLEFTL